MVGGKAGFKGVLPCLHGASKTVRREAGSVAGANGRARQWGSTAGWGAWKLEELGALAHRESDGRRRNLARRVGSSSKCGQRTRAETVAGQLLCNDEELSGMHDALTGLGCGWIIFGMLLRSDAGGGRVAECGKRNKWAAENKLARAAAGWAGVGD